MQNPSPFSTPPPIPTPDGNLSPVQRPDLVINRSDWKSAPPIVRGWAYPLTWLNIVATPVIMLASFADGNSVSAEKISLSVFLGLLFIFVVWLNRVLKKGAPAAWNGQIVLSIIGLFGFPVGTLINVYILSQWFKPETKAWFGRS